MSEVKKVLKLSLCYSMDCSLPGSSVHGILQAGILEWIAVPFSRGSSQPRNQTWSPTLQVDSLSAEPQGKPKNTGVDSLSLLQQIFLTQGSNLHLLSQQVDSLPLCHLGSPFRKSALPILALLLFSRITSDQSLNPSGPNLPFYFKEKVWLDKVTFNSYTE